MSVQVLTEIDLYILAVLMEREKFGLYGCTFKELGIALNISRQGATLHVDRLIQAGLITKEKNTYRTLRSSCEFIPYR